MIPHIPIEVKEAIVGTLRASPETLRSLSSTSKSFNPSAQSFIFRDIHIPSIRRLHELYLLLGSPHCTVPTSINALTIDMHTQDSLRLDVKLGAALVGTYLDAILEHFESVRKYMFLQTPWVVSMTVDWTFAYGYHQLRKFVLAGTHSWPGEVITALACMTSLESLVIAADWNQCYERRVRDMIPNGESLPSTLKELCLTPSSLMWLEAMTYLNAGPEWLHILRIKVDGARAHWTPLETLRRFFESYGQRIAHIYLWIETCTREVYQTFAAALQFSPRLYQLELFLPSLEEGSQDMQGVLDEMCLWGRPTSMNYQGWYSIAVDDTEFWEAPSCGGGEAH